MKKLTALAVLSMAGLALAQAPAQAAPIAQAGSLGQAQGLDTGYHGTLPTTAELCHRDLAQYPVVGPLADSTTGACEALGATVDGQ
ncbi:MULTISPECIES: hypothetical protein [Kitasatospora]|uniref:Uncharacterized protein n=1 Tax=Kitasatospora setae (strain ATCC 33774 / DSM 43861 / JCM 3304 / KCC A-0304 / NBRC 14216 / KM-6054) TaxID=452652 RepID=E4MZX6_KITSK|nr:MULTISPECIES: hypothetical protein [Kitasatospora]BAJ30060.1 hypothetical protein KSE_42750 [Kitasatospora setae KM-6054]